MTMYQLKALKASADRLEKAVNDMNKSTAEKVFELVKESLKTVMLIILAIPIFVICGVSIIIRITLGIVIGLPCKLIKAVIDKIAES